MSHLLPTPNSDPDLDEQLSLVAFGALLADGSPAAWDALRAEGPRSLDDDDRSSPISAALVRIVTPESWLALGDDHFEAALKVQDRPFGFLPLALEEAAEIVARDVLVAAPALSEVGYLLKALLTTHPGEPPLSDATRRFQALAATAHAWRGDPDGARARLDDADRLGKILDDRIRLRLVEAEARHVAHADSPRASMTHYFEALALSAQISPLRHLEVLDEAVGHGLSGSEPRDRLTWAVRAVLGAAREETEDLRRAHLLCRSGWHAGRVARGLLGFQTPLRRSDRAALADLAGELESAEPLVQTVGDSASQETYHGVLGRLRQATPTVRTFWCLGGPLDILDREGRWVR